MITAQGYENTTVLQIATKAGLTERTFFRKFKNKADIFFAGGEQYSQMLLTKMKESKANNPLAIVLESYFTLQTSLMNIEKEQSKDKNNCQSPRFGRTRTFKTKQNRRTIS